MTEEPASVEQRQEGDTQYVTVRGALTERHATAVKRLLVAALAYEERRPVVLDLRGVTEMDSSGLGLVWTAARGLKTDGLPVTLLVAQGGQPAHLMALAGFEAVLTVRRDPADGP